MIFFKKNQGGINENFNPEKWGLSKLGTKLKSALLLCTIVCHLLSMSHRHCIKIILNSMKFIHAHVTLLTYSCHTHIVFVSSPKPLIVFINHCTYPNTPTYISMSHMKKHPSPPHTHMHIDR